MYRFLNLLRKLSPTAESGVTKLADLIDPEVMADLIISKLNKKISVIPYAKVDTTLKGRPGDTVKVPTYTWDGEAREVGEGEEIPIRELGSKMVSYTVKKAGIGTSITDEALESGLGDPVGVSTDGITKSILAKTDIDAMICLQGASTMYDATKAVVAANRIIGYHPVVHAIDLFCEETNTEKVIFVHPHQMTQLRDDPKFQSKETYNNQVVVNGEVGMIANARVVVSNRVACIGGCYYNPIVKLMVDDETELEIPAVTYYLKRDTNIERERKARKRLWEITGDQMYLVALTNDSRVVLLKTEGADLIVKSMYDASYEYPNTTFVLDTTGVKPTLSLTAANAYTLNLAGKAPELASDVRTGLGFDASATNEAVVLVGIPSAPLRNFDPTQVYYNGTAMSASDIMVVNGEPYLVLVRALWLSAGAITGASASFTLKYGSDGTTNTFTWAYDGLTLA